MQRNSIVYKLSVWSEYDRTWSSRLSRRLAFRVNHLPTF